MSRRRRESFAVLDLRCQVCRGELGRYGRHTDGTDQRSWLRKAPRAVIDDGPEGDRIIFRCGNLLTDQRECGAAPVTRTARLDASLDALIRDRGPRSSAVVLL